MKNYPLLFIGIILVGSARADTETDIRVAMAMAQAVPAAPPPAFTAGPVAPAALPAIDFDLSALNAAPVVAAPAAFQRGSFNPSHSCPECGRITLAKSGRGPVAGSHVHRCPVDGCWWWHDDK